MRVNIGLDSFLGVGFVGWWDIGFEQAVRTNGYICESLVAVAGIGKRFLDLSELSIANGSELVTLLTGPTIDGGAAPTVCASNAVATIASFLQAYAHNRSLTGQDTRSILMESIEVGLGGIVKRLLTGAAVGERRTITAGGVSAISVSRMRASSLTGPAAIFQQRIQTDSGLKTVDFSLPPTFAHEVFGLNLPVVDAELSLHSIAPASENATIVSGLCALTISLADNGTQSVQGLSQPIVITIPMNTQVASSSDIPTSRFQCVFWNGMVYDSRGCWVSGVIVQQSTVVAVKCACTHLTTFAVAYDGQFVEVKPSVSSGPNLTNRGVETTAAFSTSPTLLQSTSSPVAGILLVSCNLTGSFGSVTSFGTLLTQKDIVRSILTAGITESLRVSLGTDDGFKVVVVIVCWASQCLSFSNRRDLISSNSGMTAQLQVDFELVCSSFKGITQASTTILSSNFRSILSLQISSLAFKGNLGNWTVVASMPEISTLNVGEFADLRPVIKYNGSVAIGGSGIDSNLGMLDQGKSNLQLIVGLAAGLSVVFLVLVYCIFNCFSELQRRQKLKLHPEEVKKLRRKSQIQSQNLIAEKYPEFAAAFVSDPDETNDVGDLKTLQDGGKGEIEECSDLNDGFTPILEWRDSGVSAPVDNEKELEEKSGDQDRRPPPLEFVQSFGGDNLTATSEIQPSFINDDSTSSSNLRGVAQIRLKHARTKLATLQRRLDRFIEEAAKSGPARPKLPGAAEDPTSPQSLRSALQRDQLVPTSSLRVGVETSQPASQSPVDGGARTRQFPPLLVRPNPPDLVLKDLLTSTTPRNYTSRWMPASPSNQTAQQSPPVYEGQLMRPAAVMVGRLAQRLHLLAEQDQQPPPPPPPRGDGTANSPLSADVVPPPPFRPERVRPRVWHITSPVGSFGALPVTQISPRSPPPLSDQSSSKEASVGNEVQSNNSVKDPAFLDTQI